LQVEKILADMVRIKSVNPPGGETRVASYLKRLFDHYGIPGEIIEPQEGRGSFLASIGDGERSLLFLSHIDVVTATEGWSFSPFSGELKDGFVFGRGAIDCKALAAAQACSVIKLAQENKLKGRLIFAATADEETLGPLGAKYLVDNHLGRIKADFAINEGAEAPVQVGGKRCHFIAVGEKAPSWLKLSTRGTSAHGALPMLGDNAIVKMAGILRNLADYKAKPALIPVVKEVSKSIAGLEGWIGEINESNIDEFIQSLNNKNFAAYLSAITRFTVSPNVVHGGLKTNIVPDACEAEVDIRILPGQNKEQVLEELRAVLGDAEIAVINHALPTISEYESEYYKMIHHTLQESVEDDLVLPSISAGSTDSRLLRTAGIPSYGINMLTLDTDPALRRSVHGIDEKIDIASLKVKTDFLTALARRYLS
jgi:acetylornithine deacetylase/succinyl-diaminopimelate desuccinylase-like protein